MKSKEIINDNESENSSYYNITINCDGSKINQIIECSEDIYELHLLSEFIYIIRSYLNFDYRLLQFKDFRYYFINGIELISKGYIENGLSNLKEYIDVLENITKDEFNDIIENDYNIIDDLDSLGLKNLTHDMTLNNCRNSISNKIAKKILSYYNKEIDIDQFNIWIKNIKKHDNNIDLSEIIHFIIKPEAINEFQSTSTFYMGGFDFFGDKKTDRYFLSSQISIIESYKHNKTELFINEMYLDSIQNKEFIFKNGLSSIQPLMHYFEYKLIFKQQFDKKLFNWLNMMQQLYLSKYSAEKGYYIKNSFDEWFNHYQNHFGKNKYLNDISKLLVPDTKMLNSSNIENNFFNKLVDTSISDSIIFFNILNSLVNEKFHEQIPKIKHENSFFPKINDLAFIQFINQYKSTFNVGNTLLNNISWSYFFLLDAMKQEKINLYLDEYKKLLKMKSKNGEMLMYPIINSFKIYWNVGCGKGNISDDN